MKYGTATTPIAPTQIQGNLAELNSGDATTTKTIDEAQYNIAPIPFSQKTATEERYDTTNSVTTLHGEELDLTHINKAFQHQEYANHFQEKMKQSIAGMVSYSKSNHIEQPRISLQTVDYNDIRNCKREDFRVKANTLQAYKTSETLRKAGITVLGKPVPGTHTFELVAYLPSGETISGSKWNEFFDKYDDIVTQEQQQAAV